MNVNYRKPGVEQILDATQGDQMSDKQKIEELRRHDPLVHQAMTAAALGVIDYVSALEALVVAKSRESQELRNLLIEAMHNNPRPNPILLSIDQTAEFERVQREVNE